MSFKQSFGIYIHIPFCIQKCHYCDFATRPQNASEMKSYPALIQKEIRTRASQILELGHKEVTSVYFGGGTPSLMPAEDILALFNELHNAGFSLSPTAEITIEINPGTVDQKKLDLYRAAGINRFSVGVQSFNDYFLKLCGREHSAQDSRTLLRILKQNKLNYSFDLLFGLPEQNLEHLRQDIQQLLDLEPPHVSAYILTLPEKHFFSANQAEDETQEAMFHFVDDQLSPAGYEHYEISNYSKDGFFSRHNSLYWNDQPYWGLGLGSHSYLPSWGHYGTRFWNSTSLERYSATNTLPLWQGPKRQPLLPTTTFEQLKKHESLTDFLHTQLRQKNGVSRAQLQRKFGAQPLVEKKIASLVAQGLLEETPAGTRITKKYRVRANTVFLPLTLGPEDLASDSVEG